MRNLLLPLAALLLGAAPAPNTASFAWFDYRGADPSDADAAVLYAESEMLLGPWDYWLPAGRAKPHGARALATLTSLLRRAPRHAGACHFYIHAVEAAYPERAVPCAERLPSLMPGAGHVVHMPAHVYIRVGRYADERVSWLPSRRRSGRSASPPASRSSRRSWRPR